MFIYHTMKNTKKTPYDLYNEISSQLRDKVEKFIMYDQGSFTSIQDLLTDLKDLGEYKKEVAKKTKWIEKIYYIKKYYDDMFENNDPRTWINEVNKFCVKYFC